MTVPRALAALAALAAALAVVAGCGDGAAGDGRPSVVVTTPALGAVVREVTGDVAAVEVLLPEGADPHEFQPSARQAARLLQADLVVENGLGLEQGLEDTLGRARDDGVAVFTAGDHVNVRRGVRDGEAHADGDGHDHGDEAPDPHIWTDPIAMRDVVAALGPALERELAVDLGGRPARVARGLERLDAQVRAMLEAIPPQRRRMVTGHDSMGYFADRYDLEVVGAIIPSFSSQAQASAGTLAALRAQVQAAGVPAIFDEPGTPAGIARAIADETGARVVPIATLDMPGDGSYGAFVRAVAAAVRDGLTGRS
ncbi:metal ABC transporter substrate-binding protein [Miltoncostaea marina]|uniref:metal ABC transporter substrate-binding protein n=1 Tax=Miltoncostaea marina TaxID=2843215 RepID=UPI001C3CFB6F|nr:metal ABC transporter substrate-binding protein [Miltoncostaea marina]